MTSGRSKYRACAFRFILTAGWDEDGLRTEEFVVKTKGVSAEMIASSSAGGPKV
jgi:hypothetical protein